MVLDREPNSNLSQLLRFMSVKDCDLEKWLLGKLTYTSAENQNELIDIMGRMVLRTATKKIQAAGHYTIMVDESPDASNREQAVFCLR